MPRSTFCDSGRLKDFITYASALIQSWDVPRPQAHGIGQKYPNMVVKTEDSAIVPVPVLTTQMCELEWVTSHFSVSLFTKGYLPSLK